MKIYGGAESIQVVQGGTSASVDYVADFTDVNANVVVDSGVAQGNQGSAGSFTLIPGPATNSYTREVQVMNFINNDPVNSCTIQVQKVNIAGTVNLTGAVPLLTGYSLRYDVNTGWQVFDANGFALVTGVFGPIGNPGQIAYNKAGIESGTLYINTDGQIITFLDPASTNTALIGMGVNVVDSLHGLLIQTATQAAATGDILLRTGDVTANSVNPGTIYIVGGNTQFITSSDEAGQVILSGGSAGWDGSAYHAGGGVINLFGAAGTQGGAAQVSGGIGDAQGGDANISGGEAVVSGNGGNVNIQSGAPAGTGIYGSIGLNTTQGLIRLGPALTLLDYGLYHNPQLIAAIDANFVGGAGSQFSTPATVDDGAFGTYTLGTFGVLISSGTVNNPVVGAFCTGGGSVANPAGTTWNGEAHGGAPVGGPTYNMGGDAFTPDTTVVYGGNARIIAGLGINADGSALGGNIQIEAARSRNNVVFTYDIAGGTGYPLDGVFTDNTKNGMYTFNCAATGDSVQAYTLTISGGEVTAVSIGGQADGSFGFGGATIGDVYVLSVLDTSYPAAPSVPAQITVTAVTNQVGGPIQFIDATGGGFTITSQGEWLVPGGSSAGQAILSQGSGLPPTWGNPTVVPAVIPATGVVGDILFWDGSNLRIDGDFVYEGSGSLLLGQSGDVVSCVIQASQTLAGAGVNLALIAGAFVAVGQFPGQIDIQAGGDNNLANPGIPTGLINISTASATAGTNNSVGDITIQTGVPDGTGGDGIIGFQIGVTPGLTISKSGIAGSIQIGINGSGGGQAQIVYTDPATNATKWANAVNKQIITTTGADTIADGPELKIFAAFNGAQATETITFPTPAFDGQILGLKFNAALAAITITGSVIFAITSAVAGQYIEYIWDNSSGFWQ